MTILVFGANGQLDNEMRIVALGSKDRYIFTDVNQVSEEQLSMLRKLVGEDVDTSTIYLDITDVDAVCKIVWEQDVNTHSQLCCLDQCRWSVRSCQIRPC